MARILLFDADRQFAGRIARGLSSAGHQCLIEPTAARLERIAEKSIPDLIITEAMLPRTSGFEVCRRARRHPKLFTLPILILSSMSDEEEIQHGLAQGADDYLAKPCEMTQLLRHIDALLQDNADCLTPERLTGLANVKRIRREMQRRMSLREAFAVAYIEMLHVQRFARQQGIDARDKVIAWFGRALDEAMRDTLPAATWLLGHTGAGHFVAILPVPDAVSYCHRVRSLFDDRRDEMCLAAGCARPSASPRVAAQGSEDDLALLVCVTFKTEREYVSPPQLFETLSRLRHDTSCRQDGVHIDRRGG